MDFLFSLFFVCLMFLTEWEIMKLVISDKRERRLMALKDMDNVTVSRFLWVQNQNSPAGGKETHQQNGKRD